MTFSVSNRSQSRIVSLLDALRRDLRLTFRGLRRRPGFTLAVIASLALGIGANTAIFSHLDATLLRPLPVPHSHELIRIDVVASRLTQFGDASYLDYSDLRTRSHALANLAIDQPVSAAMSTAQRDSQVVYGMLVSGSFFSTLQVQPVLGRDFRPEEDTVPGKYPVVIISDALWSRVFAGNKNIIGKQVKLNGQSFTIIGVAPKSFTGTSLFFRPDIYVPAMMAQALLSDGNEMLTHRSDRGFEMIARLTPGITVAQAQADLDAITRDLERTYPDTNKGTAAIVRYEMDRRFAGQLQLPALLMGLTLLVLLIACANVSGLLMARSTSRIREISTQLAVGASRGSLVRQLLTETAVLTALGGLCGIGLGFVCIRAFASTLPYSPVPSAPDFHLDLRVLGFALAASASAVFLAGLAPAFAIVKEATLRINTNVRAGVADSQSYAGLTRRALMVGQIALSTVLLFAGGLLLKTFERARHADVGFNPEHLLLVNLDPSLQGHSGDNALQFQQHFLQQVATLPGVKSASLASFVPFVNGASWDVSIDGYTPPGGEKFFEILTNQLAPGYFHTMQIPLLCGRDFTLHDDKNSPLVAIVNQTLARQYMVGNGSLEQALGRNLRLRDRDHVSIIGVVKDSTTGAIGKPVHPTFYMPYAQMGDSNATLYVRAEGDPTALTAAVREQLRALDADVAPLSVVTMKRVVSSQGLLAPRLAAILAGSFAAVALSLALVGLYGIVSFLVARRTHEIGVRMALGAKRSNILNLVLADGFSIAATGLLIGTVLAFLAAPLIRDLLLDVKPRDPAILLAIASALLATTLAASGIPALRATRVDPVAALRSE